MPFEKIRHGGSDKEDINIKYVKECVDRTLTFPEEGARQRACIFYRASMFTECGELFLYRKRRYKNNKKKKKDILKEKNGNGI